MIAVRRTLMAMTALSGLMGSGLACAQTPEAAGGDAVEEIIVTAQKRAERLQDVPLSVTAVTQDAMDARGISDVSGLSELAPNVAINPGFVNPTGIAAFIRGIGTFTNEPLADAPIAVSVDGVYMASVYGGLLNTFDLQQVEVLRGPQGTLQGRNAPGGAINVTTRRPAFEFGGRVELGYGRFDEFRANASVEGPLVADRLAVKLAVMRNRSDGYVKNLLDGERFGGRDSWAGRAGMLIKADERLTLYLTGDYVRDKSPQGAMRAANTPDSYPRPETGRQLRPVACSVFGFCTPDPRYTARVGFTDRSSFRSWGTTLNADLDLDAATVSLVSGYRSTKDISNQDVDRLPVPILHTENNRFKSEETSAELRIASNRGGGADLDGRLQWILGAYYQNFKFRRVNPVRVLGNLSSNTYRQSLDSYALFGHVDYDPIEDLTIYAGGRQTWDKKHFQLLAPIFVDRNASFRNFSSEAGLRYRFAEGKMAYARFSQGYRAGGFIPQGAVFDPEKVDSFELGLKTEWLDRRVQVNLSGFHYDYADLQRLTSVQIPVPPFFQQQTRNVGKARIRGVELEMVAVPAHGLRLTGSAGYLDAKYKRYIVQEPDPTSPGNLRDVDNSALRLPFAPKWTLSGSVEYKIPLGAVTVTPAAYVSFRSSHTTNAEDVPVQAEDGYTLVNATLRISDADDRYSITGYVDNLFNSYYIIGAGTTSNLAHFQIDAPPRTYGVRVAARF